MDIYADGTIYPSEYLAAAIIVVIIVALVLFITRREEHKRKLRLEAQEQLNTADAAVKTQESSEQPSDKQDFHSS